MPRIALLISDHGWGHAGRMSALVAELAGRGWPVLVLAGEAVAGGLRARIPVAAFPAVDVRAGALDRGLVVRAGGRGVDIEATRALLEESLHAPNPALRRVVLDWDPDVVIADATPWGADLARDVPAPSILCTNFSWEEQYASVLGETAEVARLRERVRRFDHACRIPIGTTLDAVAARTDVGLISRLPRAAAPEALAAVGLDPSVPPVTWSMGRSPASEQPLELLAALAGICHASRVPLIASSTLAPAGVPGVTRFVPDEVYWPDLLAASRLVVSKAGYSTIAETLRGGGRVLVLRGLHTAEERAIAGEVEAKGFGASVGFAGRVDLEAFGATVRALLAAPPRDPIRERGEVQVADVVEAIAGR